MALVVKNPLANAGETQVPSLGREDPLEEEMAARSSILAGKFRGQRGLAGYSPWGHKKSDTTQHIHIHNVLFCIHTWSLRECLRAKILEVPIDISLQVVSTWASHRPRESPVGDLLKCRSILNSLASAGVVLTALPPFGEKICWETSEEKKI